MEKHALYLGIFLPFGWRKKLIFDQLINKLTKKTLNWKDKILSKARKLGSLGSFLVKENGMGGFEIKDLQHFNRVQLTKQTWRFLSMPNSLQANYFKHAYFPTTCFLDSSLGKNPSLVWKALQWAKPLIKAREQQGLGIKLKFGKIISVELVILISLFGVKHNKGRLLHMSLS